MRGATVAQGLAGHWLAGGEQLHYCIVHYFFLFFFPIYFFIIIKLSLSQPTSSPSFTFYNSLSHSTWANSYVVLSCLSG